MDLTSIYCQRQPDIGSCAETNTTLTGIGGGLRRVPLHDLKENPENTYGVNDRDSLNSASIYYCNAKVEDTKNPETTENTQNNVEEQKHQLLGICEMIQVKVKGILERISKLLRWTETNNGNPKDLLDEYQQRAWPVLVESESEIKLLSQTIRQTIDACNINEGCLDWLLAVHKFQVSIEEMLEQLTSTINNDIERVLSIRVRAPGITGLTLKPETLESLQNMQKAIRQKSFRI